MVLINQKVADEVATLVARYRYAVEDSTDAIKAAEAASARCNEEIQQAADERHRALTERVEQGRKAEEEQPNEWTARRTEIREISFSGCEIDEAPAQPPPPVRRRPAYFDEEDDFSDRRWLQ